MTQNSFGFEKLTDATVAVLQDTGNYKCDYSMAHPLVWGHPESIDGKFIEDFATGPPRKVFPSGYLDYDFTSFDYTFLNIQGSSYQFTNTTCISNPSSKICKSEKFYNPFNETILVNNYYDSINLGGMKTSRCPKGMSYIQFNRIGNYYSSPKMVCGEYECTGYESMTWRHYDTDSRTTYTLIECNKSNANQGYQIMYDSTEYTIFCPDPERFCRTIKLNNMTFNGDPFDPDYLLLPAAAKKSSKSKTGLIVGIVFAVLVVIIIAVVGVVIYLKLRGRKGDSNSSGENID